MSLVVMADPLALLEARSTIPGTLSTLVRSHLLFLLRREKTLRVAF